MAFDIKGKLYMIMETQVVSERFSKREFVVEMEDGKYPQFILFQSTGDRIEALNDMRVGDEVRVTFNIRGREWKSPKGETKFFVSLDVWKIDHVDSRAGERRGSDSRGGDRREYGGGGGGETKRPPDDDIPFASCDMAYEPSAIARILR